MLIDGEPMQQRNVACVLNFCAVLVNSQIFIYIVLLNIHPSIDGHELILSVIVLCELEPTDCDKN